MNREDLRTFILSGLEDVVFVYHNIHAIIIPLCEDGIPYYEVGFGDVDKTHTDIDELMSDPIFDGKSLNEICEQLDIN